MIDETDLFRIEIRCLTCNCTFVFEKSMNFAVKARLMIILYICTISRLSQFFQPP